MMTRHDTAEQREQHYKNLYDQQTRVIKMLTKKNKQQSKELMKVRHDNKMLINLNKQIKDSLTTQRWKYSTPEEIDEKMKKLKKRIDQLEKNVV